MAKGKHEEKIENARKLKELGVPANIIQQATGLTEEEINDL